MKDIHTCLYASCDEVYLRKYGIAFAMAAAKKGWPLHLSAINEGNEQSLKGLLSLIAHAFQLVHKESEAMTWSIDSPWYAWKNDRQRQIVLAANRFFTASKLLRQSSRSLLIVDIDSFVSRSPRYAPPPHKIGLYLRDKNCSPSEADWRAIGKSVLAGIVHVPLGELGNKFLQDVQQSIRSEGFRWYADQVALFKSYKMLESPASVFEFNETHMGWTRSGCAPLLWTAKGDLKHKDRFYLRKKKQLLRTFVQALTS